ncbi:hypothetical protein AB0M89_13405 [Streptomyces microflavus]|uniref:hypothetical protein n=1 Tax=Streptomyces microflavus TaxID=1919 RepID=UPI00343CEC84
MSPITCTKCGDTAGPFVPGKLPVCENCTSPTDAEVALRSALEDGGWLDGNARSLMDAYAATVLGRAANTLRTVPGCESSARIVDNLVRGLAS